MEILMLGNSFTTAGGLPQKLEALTGARVVCHTRGGARLSQQLNPATALGSRTLEALATGHWDYVILQEMSHGPITSPARFLDSVEKLCALVRKNGAQPVLFATWAYQPGGARLKAKGWDYGWMAQALDQAYRQAARDTGALLAAVGQAFYEYPDPPALYAPDGVHPSSLGAQLAAQTIAALLETHKEDKL